MSRRYRVAVSIVFIMVGLVAIGQAGQTTGPRMVPLVPDTMYGPDLFRLYCATCHGRDAKGDGPAASALKTRPSDLTALAKRSSGVFPRTQIESFVTAGAGGPAHGSAEMPIWGPIFRALDPSDARVKVRIANLVSYIESIQGK